MADARTTTIPDAKTVTIMGAGIVGALAYAFSDSFWFSAVEAEVYSMSSFFTALVVWVMLKWDVVEDKSKANRWLILLAYMIGLSIGFHLLMFGYSASIGPLTPTTTVAIWPAARTRTPVSPRRFALTVPSALTEAVSPSLDVYSA